MRTKLLYILFVGAIVVASSCNKKVDPIEITNENENQSFGDHPDAEDLDRSIADIIYGTWELKAWYENEPKDINKDGQASTDLLAQWNGCFKQSELVLSTDPSGKIVYTGESNNPKCKTGFEKGDFKTTDYWELIQEEERRYLRFVGDDYYDIYEIILLNSTTLTLEGAGFLTCCSSSISYYTKGYLSYEKK